MFAKQAVYKLYENTALPNDNGCMLWLAGIDGHGYGTMCLLSKPVKAHRFSYYVHNGALTASLFVMHTCDVRACVAPDHLVLGTRLDNIEDCVAKERHARGTMIAGSKLTEDNVRDIRKMLMEGTTGRVVAHHFGVSEGTISMIRSGQRWAWLY